MNPVNAMVVNQPEDYLHSDEINYIGLDTSLLEVEIIETLLTTC